MKKMQRLYFSPAARQNIGRALLAGAICWSALPLHAQNPPPDAPQQIQPGAQALLNQDDLRELLGPIALYPDALIAIILPASTVPSDVVLGSRFVEGKGDPAQAGSQPWDDSVKSLVYYPDVLSWMNENLEWTASVGEAFMDQPADVMNAIQSLRAQARASGALADTPQQKVVVQEEFIRIVPADPEIIYVPQYDPEVIFVDSYSPGYTPFLTFGFGFAVGSWMNYDCDWGRRGVYRGDWIGWNRGGRGWNGNDTYINNTVVNNTNVNVVNINNATQWNPSNRSRRQIEQRQKNGNGNVRFTTAEARATRDLIRTERRNNNGKVSNNTLAAARRDALPNPKKLELREASFNRTAKAQNRENRPDNTAPLAEARKDRENARPNAPAVAAAEQRQELRRKTPTEAPRVKDQIETPRQVRKSDKVEEPRRDAPVNRQNAREQVEQRQNNVPERQNKVSENDRPSERPSVTKRQNEPAPQNYRTERQEPKADKPKVQQQVRQPQAQPRQVERQQARPEPKRQEVRQNVERPQQQKRQEAKPQQKQENRSANRPQQQQQAQPKKAEKKASKSDDSDKKKKND